MKNKITILLGAGFAMYLKGLGTKHINNIFASDRKYTVEDKSLYTYINDKLESIYHDFNFETFLAILENILEYRMGKECPGQSFVRDRSVLSVLFELNPLFDKIETISNGERIYEVYSHYLNLLIDSINSYDNTYKCQTQMEIFVKYVRYLSQKYSKIKIYSTNYDFLIPHWFENHSVW